MTAKEEFDRLITTMQITPYHILKNLRECQRAAVALNDLVILKQIESRIEDVKRVIKAQSN